MAKEYGFDDIDDTFGAWGRKRNSEDYGTLDGIQRAGLENGTWQPKSWEQQGRDLLSGVDSAKTQLPSPNEKSIQVALQTLPDVVLEDVVEAAARLRAHKIDPSRPATIPNYLTVDQIAETFNRAALYQPEYDRRAPEREERQRIAAAAREAQELKAAAGRAVRQFIVQSVPLTPDMIHTNGTNGHTNGTNGHSSNGNGHAKMPFEADRPIPTRQPVPVGR